MASSTGQPPELDLALLLFVATCLLLLAAFLAVLLTALGRRRGRTTKARPARPDGPDPWLEAAKRLRPFGTASGKRSRDDDPPADASA